MEKLKEYENLEEQGKLLNSCSQVEVLKWFVGEWEKVKNV